ncbi:MAG: hypothetical protein KQH63_04835 [Desulfobulbaceae bacterium]|nr:hypothetical protein [Desulfobulbaceae bacterium]
MKRTSNKSFFLGHITSWKHQEWLDQSVSSNTIRLMIGVSGYESRSSDWMKKTLQILTPGSRNTYCIIGFNDYRQALNRPHNDKFYNEKKLSVVVPEDKGAEVLDVVKEVVIDCIGNSGDTPVEVHVDYSSMPRSWYCNLPFVLSEVVRACDKLFFWYTPGSYPETEYPTAGVEDFSVFSGRPSLNPEVRTHCLGLGFDRIRSHAIWSVLDPANLVCFFASPGTRPDYVERVERDNEDILSGANHVFSIDMRDFAYAYSRIAGVVREFHRLGDVILVPDGPKPLILASSLVPVVFGHPGIVCFHVSRRQNQQSEPVNVNPFGPAYGFSFCVPE